MKCRYNVAGQKPNQRQQHNKQNPPKLENDMKKVVIFFKKHKRNMKPNVKVWEKNFFTHDLYGEDWGATHAGSVFKGIMWIGSPQKEILVNEIAKQMLEYVIRSYWQHVLAPRMSEGFLQWNCCLCTWQWEGLCVQSRFWKDLEESQGTNGMRPDVCCGGGKIETLIRNGINRHTDGYDTLGRSQHSSEGKSSPTNLLQFSEEVAEQVDKISLLI